MIARLDFFFPVKRQDLRNLPYAYAICMGVRQISEVLPLLNSISQGGFTGKKFLTVQSQIRPLATHTPNLGRCGQGAWLESLPPIRQLFFLVTLEFLDISSKKMCL